MTRTLAIWRGKGWSVALEWRPQDVWIGAYWRTDEQWGFGDLWLCILPMLLIHFEWVDA